jgi:hypothetical protein
MSLIIAPSGAFFHSKLAKKGYFWSKKGDFPGFQFTDKYTETDSQVIYYVQLTLIAAAQKAEF